MRESLEKSAQFYKTSVVMNMYIYRQCIERMVGGEKGKTSGFKNDKNGKSLL